jgi:hypothetical protein
MAKKVSRGVKNLYPNFSLTNPALGHLSCLVVNVGNSEKLFFVE